MKQHHAQSGYSLVEALVAISVLLIAIVGPMTIAAQGIKSSQFALEQNTAFFLAQEGIEAIFAIRNDYAVADVDDGFEAANDNSWEWIDDVIKQPSGPCPPGQLSNPGGCKFGVDFSSPDVASNLTSNQCGDAETLPADCRLYLNELNPPTVYRLSGAPASPYYRVITLTETSGNSIEVKSTVTWESHVFGGAVQTVQLTTYLFDSNYETP